MQKRSGAVVYSPSDLIRYFASPFASWMDRYHLENPDGITPDEETEEEKLVAETGDRYEISVLTELKAETRELVEIPKENFADAHTETLSAISAKVPIIFQAALDAGQFAGFADFLILDESGRYQVWDTKLARAPKPYYANARWIESGESRAWNASNILKGIRDYNEDDCKSTAELTNWLRTIASNAGIPPASSVTRSIPSTPKVLSPGVTTRQDTAEALRLQSDPVSAVLSDLVEFHRREEKPMWWRMYDRAKSSCALPDRQVESAEIAKILL